ncbi:rhamnogalacturonan acetylesterase [Gaeumannomyces tritici R3-111a-1]|uniref:Rhamnogalacturonan acetylesterase n=1 Tax=Gaeumannomyces tritici (strain R3-111a-1) TaxID=644352 RepID=J3NUW6_GAET3|nr:rhamnogalacturonan acetylesterase [Gaeumannomyces tritici R3-111a-1]EJT79993.1 rhamnogalacturonan acetylesterase [Gaeumannomyces tritici R3-111a-1]
MRLTLLSTAIALAWSFGASALPTAPEAATADALEARQAPRIFLCGDSTMARNTAGIIDGWGNYLAGYVTATVENRAIGGRSARSFWNEGRFRDVANAARAGDVVVIEFGHNDGGSPRSNDNGRSACPGTGTETCVSDKTGETVYTFPYYVIQGAKLMLAKGANVVLSAQTPRNQWEGGTYNGEPSRFVDYMSRAHRALADSRATFVNHNQAVSNMYRKMGNSAVNALYPQDRTHTGPRGADLSAQAFVQAVYQKMNGETSLTRFVKTPVNIVY